MLQAACDGRVGRRGAQVQLGQARVRARAGRSRGHIRVAALAACAGGAAPTLSEVVWKFLNVRTVACARCQRLTRVLHDPPCQALDDQQACAMQATSSRLLPSPEVSHRQQTLQRAGVCCRLCVCSSRQQRVAAPDEPMTPGLESLACAVPSYGRLVPRAPLCAAHCASSSPVKQPCPRGRGAQRTDEVRGDDRELARDVRGDPLGGCPSCQVQADLFHARQAGHHVLEHRLCSSSAQPRLG